MAEAQKIEERTLKFIEEHKRLKELGIMPIHKELAIKIGVKSKTTISEILNKRQNIQPDQWETFKKLFDIKEVQSSSEYSVSRETNTDIIMARQNNNIIVVEAKSLSAGYEKIIESNERFIAEKEARRLEAERTAEYLKEQLAKEKADKDKLFAALEKAQDVLIKSTERLDANLIESLEHLRNLELKANIIAQQIEGLPAVHEIMIPVEKKKVAASASKGGKSSGAHKKDGV